MQVDLRSTQLRVLTLSFEPSLGSFDTRALDAFLADKELLDVREHFFVVRDLPYLLCLLTYRVAAAKPNSATLKPTREREGLDAPTRTLFDTLRTWRRERARDDGVPPYVLFTDRELAALAQARPNSRNALVGIPGVGPRKVERYGEDLLRLMIPPATPTTAEEPSS